MPTNFQTPISTYEGFNIDPAYLTPSYMAAFRPNFEPGRPGQNPYEVNMSEWQATKTVFGFNPLSQDIDPTAQQSAALDTLSNIPGDVATEGLSRFAAPIAGYMAAHYLLNKTGISSYLSKAIFPNAGRAAGHVAGRMGSAGIRTSLGVGSAAMGKGFRSGFTASLPKLLSSRSMAAGLGALGAGAGSLAASFLAPMAAIYAGGKAIDLYDSAVSDQYTATRNGARTTQGNMLHQFVGGSGGSASGSLGVSSERATDIALASTMAGASDWALDATEVNKITDAAMRGGLFSHQGDLNISHMEKGIKGILSTVKAIVAMGAAADSMGAVELMSKMKGAGITDFRDMAIVSTQLSSAAAAAGVSVAQVMTTVGNRSQMQATQRGMLPIIGQVQAANAYAGIQNAHRAGILSSGQMAALGGVEGMTTSIMDNAYNVLDSDMGRMAMQTGLGFDTNGLDIVTAAGQQYANDPMGYEGKWALNGGARMSKALRNTPAHVITAQGLLRDTEMNTPYAFNDDNTIDISKLWPAAQAMGMSESDFRTFAETLRINQDEHGNFRLNDAMRAHAIKRVSAQLKTEDQDLVNSIFDPVQHTIKYLGQKIHEAGASSTSPLNKAASSVTDDFATLLSSASGIVMPTNRMIRSNNINQEYTLDGDIPEDNADAFKAIIQNSNIDNKYSDRISDLFELTKRKPSKSKSAAILNKLSEIDKDENILTGEDGSKGNLADMAKRLSDGSVELKQNKDKFKLVGKGYSILNNDGFKNLLLQSEAGGEKSELTGQLWKELQKSSKDQDAIKDIIWKLDRDNSITGLTGEDKIKEIDVMSNVLSKGWVGLQKVKGREDKDISQGHRDAMKEFFIDSKKSIADMFSNNKYNSSWLDRLDDNQVQELSNVFSGIHSVSDLTDKYYEATSDKYKKLMERRDANDLIDKARDPGIIEKHLRGDKLTKEESSRLSVLKEKAESENKNLVDTIPYMTSLEKKRLASLQKEAESKGTTLDDMFPRLTDRESKELTINDSFMKSIGLNYKDVVNLDARGKGETLARISEDATETIDNFNRGNPNLEAALYKFRAQIEKMKKDGTISSDSDTEDILFRASNIVDMPSFGKILSREDAQAQETRISDLVIDAANMSNRGDLRIVVEGQLEDIMGSNNQQLGLNSKELQRNTSAIEDLTKAMGGKGSINIGTIFSPKYIGIDN